MDCSLESIGTVRFHQGCFTPLSQGGDVDKLQNALTFIFTARGIPVVFQGTEQNRGNANGQIINGIADTWNCCGQAFL